MTAAKYFTKCRIVATTLSRFAANVSISDYLHFVVFLFIVVFKVWYERSFIVWQLLQLGYNVVQSDGDALWLQNPLYEFSELIKTSDVIFSRGNARAGDRGRGTGVCMGLVMYKSSAGAIDFLHDILERMPVANDVDQGIANSFVGGSRGLNRDKNKYNPEYWRGVYKNTT